MAALHDVVLREPLFTSADVAAATGATGPEVSRLLARLDAQGTVTKVMRGLWAGPWHPMFSPYLVVGHLADVWQAPAYVTGTTALHLHGILSQIPREIHVATRDQHAPLDTRVGHYVFHRLDPDLLGGDRPGDRWGRFQLATPEKALFDLLYLGLHQGRRWSDLPELELPSRWRWRAWDPWLSRVAFRPFQQALRSARNDMAHRLGPALRPPPSPPGPGGAPEGVAGDAPRAEPGLGVEAGAEAAPA